MKKKFVVEVGSLGKGLPHWDLSVAFYNGLNDPQILSDIEDLKKLAKELSLYRDTFWDMEPYQLSNFLRKYESFVTTSRKLSYYAFLYNDTHKTDEEATIFQSKIKEIVANSFEKLGFVHYELNELPQYKQLEFINHPKLQRWIPWLMGIFSCYWPLGEGVSFIINKKSIVSSAWDRLYGESCADLKFHFKGKVLNEADIMKKLGSRDPEIRHAAAVEMNRVFKENARLFTMCYNMILKDDNVDDEIYGIREPVASSLSENNIKKVDLLAMVNEVVDTYIPTSQRFYKLIAKMMKVDTLRYEDRNFNPVEITEKKISWSDCLRQVLDAYINFSPEYYAYAAQIVNSNIIDVPSQPGKVSGAYCIRGSYPYILLNFSGSRRDVATFAHELGHGVHHLLSASVGVLNDSTPTALAEVASEFAENLIFQQQMEDAESDREKLALLIDRVSDMISSIHRQIAFYKFEERAHRERKEGELTTKRLNQIWREECSRYLGFDPGEDAEYMWMGISHLFGMPYYVYSYAFAGLVVNNLIKAYEKWEDDGEFEIREDFSDLYIDMLSSTGVEDFVSLLQPFGIEADAPDFWSKGMKVLDEYIDEIEKLAKKEGLI